MRLVQLPANNVQPGMFVPELHRPWLQAPIELQGFEIRNGDDVEFVAGHCDRLQVDWVQVDWSYVERDSLDTSSLPLHPVAADSPAGASGDANAVAAGPAEHTPAGPALYPHPPRMPSAAGKTKAAPNLPASLHMRDDFQQAKAWFERATRVLERTFDALRRGRRLDITDMRDAVAPLIDGVFRNKEAVAALVRLEDDGDYLHRHSVAMAVWAAILGRQIGLDRAQLARLATGCALADVGMTNLPATMSKRAGPLTDDETRLLRRHPELGAALVRRNGTAGAEIIAIIEAHQERWDGSGYPRGLRGPEIPLVARVAGLVDAYDAMITDRPWARARSSFEATQELVDVKDVLFQGALVEQFIQAVGVFPTGALVELNSGEVGIVVRQNATRRLKPEIAIVLDAGKRRLPKLALLDLALVDLGMGGRPGQGEAARWIARELPRGAHGIDSEDYFV